MFKKAVLLGLMLCFVGSAVWASIDYSEVSSVVIPNEFRPIKNMLVDSSGAIILSDGYKTGKIAKDGAILSQTESESLINGIDIDRSNQDQIVILSQGELKFYNNNLGLIKNFNVSEKMEGFSPSDVAVDPAGEYIYVIGLGITNPQSYKVFTFSNAGDLISISFETVPPTSSLPPTFLGIDSSHYLYLTESNIYQGVPYYQVIKGDSQGTHIADIGTLGANNIGIVVDKDDYIYVGNNSGFEKYSSVDEKIGEMILNQNYDCPPKNMAVDDKLQIYLIDVNNVIHIFAPPVETGQVTNLTSIQQLINLQKQNKLSLLNSSELAQVKNDSQYKIFIKTIPKYKMTRATIDEIKKLRPVIKPAPLH